MVALCVALVACRTGDEGQETPIQDGGYEVPRPVVVTEVPDGAAGDAPRIGAVTVVGNRDALTPPSDAPVVGEGGVISPPDAAGTCSVIAQNCERTKGCYVNGAGDGYCAVAGDLGLHTPCGDHTQCAPGLLCLQQFGALSGLCEAVCDPARTDMCPRGEICWRYSSAVGFCLP
jgi:hypothetical protein